MFSIRSTSKSVVASVFIYNTVSTQLVPKTEPDRFSGLIIIIKFYEGGDT